MKKIKIAFAASSGGHLEQLMMLKPLMEKYDCIILTEKTKYNAKSFEYKTFYMKQVNRREITFIFNMIINAFKSFKIMLKEKPNIIICTGVLAMIPMCLLCKLFGGKLIFIESFAKISSPTMTGRFLYRFADRFYVQWEQMKEFYPEAIYLGGIY